MNTLKLQPHFGIRGVGISLALLILLLLGGWVQAQSTPQYIPLQGQLTDQDGKVIQSGTETYTYTVTIYDNANSANYLWQDSFKDQSIINGVFNVMLGSQVPLPTTVWTRLSSQGVLYVGITITKRNGIDVPGGGVEMRPRLTLVAVPFAVQANAAKTADTAQYAVKAINADLAGSAALLAGINPASIFVKPDATSTSLVVKVAQTTLGTVANAEHANVADHKIFSATQQNPFNGNFSPSQVSGVGFSLPVQSTGRPMLMMVTGSINLPVINQGGHYSWTIRLLCDDTTVEDIIIGGDDSATTSAHYTLPLSFITLTTAAAGAHSYSITVQNNDSTQMQFNLYNGKMFAVEF